MTITTNAGFDTAAAAPAVGVMYLIEMDFTGGTLYLTNWSTNVTVGANTYTGLGNVGSVSEIKESEDGSIQKVNLELSQVNSAYLSLGLGGVSTYQNRAVRIYVALTDATLAITGSPVLRFAGFMNKVSIKRGSNNKGSVVMECDTGGYDVRKNPVGFRLNDSQHQANKPGELGFQYVADLIGKPQQWLSKRFQTV